MRIAFLTPVYPPMVSGASLVVRLLSKDMAARGHQVLVVTASDRERPYTALEENLSIVRLTSFRNPLRVGQRLAVWPFREVTEALKGFAPDLLHVSDPIQFALPALKYSQMNRIPTVYSIQQLPWFLASYLPNIPWIRSAMEALLWKYGAWLVRQFDSITTPTRTIADIVETRTGIVPYVISNGVDLEIFKPRASNTENENALRTRFDIPADAPIILHVGRLDKDKQADLVIKACVPVLQRTDAHLLVVGDGSERGKLTQEAEALGVRPKCHFAGFVSVKDGLTDFYRLGTVFVTASQIETQGIVLLEAAASGLPIVAINATCIPEIVLHNVNGFLSPPAHPEQMGDHLLQLVQDSACAREMGKAGRIIATRHSIEKSMDACENLFAKCVSLREVWNQPLVREGNLNRKF